MAATALAMRWQCVYLMGVLALAPGARAAEPTRAPSPSPGDIGPVNSAEQWLAKSQESLGRGLMKPALEQVTRAIESSPKDPRLLHFRSRLFERMRQLPSCEADLSRALELAPAEAALWLDRGILRLRMGAFAGAVSDFDQYAERRPGRAAELWQRGIALFYVGRFAEARRQFESHRTVNPEDVENSAWHFCCVARESGVEAARKAWLPVVSDGRVPMREIQSLFRGSMKPEELLAGVESMGPPEERLAQARFYAHLYLALYHGALGEREAELRHAAEAARSGAGYGIMGEIAQRHADWVAVGLRSGALQRR